MLMYSSRIGDVIEAAERLIRSYDPVHIEGSELALARALAEIGSETGKWAVERWEYAHTPNPTS